MEHGAWGMEIKRERRERREKREREGKEVASSWQKSDVRMKATYNVYHLLLLTAYRLPFNDING